MNRGLCILIQLIISIAMTAAAAAENADYGYLDEEDPQNKDIEDSVEYAYQPSGSITLDGDLRGGFFVSDTDQRDGSNDDNSEAAGRLRYGANYTLNDNFRFKARLAVSCDDDNCSPDVDVSSRPSAGTTSNATTSRRTRPLAKSTLAIPTIEKTSSISVVIWRSPFFLRERWKHLHRGK